MQTVECGKKKDRRLLVLLALGGCILAACCMKDMKGPNAALTSFVARPAAAQKTVLLRIKAAYRPEESVPGIPITPNLSCSETPAQLAPFFDLPLPINRADHASLTMLPGIGPKLASSVLNLRQVHKTIHGPKDLLQVKGIGRSLADRLVPRICFD